MHFVIAVRFGPPPIRIEQARTNMTLRIVVGLICVMLSVTVFDFATRAVAQPVETSGEIAPMPCEPAAPGYDCFGSALPDEEVTDLAVPDRPYHLSFSPTGEYAIAATASEYWSNLEAHLWRVSGSEVTPVLTLPLSMDSNAPQTWFTPDGAWVLLCDEHALWRVDLRSGVQNDLSQWHSPWCRFDLSPDGRLLASVENETVILVRDIESMTQTHRFSSHRTQVTALAFSPSGSRLASGSEGGIGLVWGIDL